MINRRITALMLVLMLAAAGLCMPAGTAVDAISDPAVYHTPSEDYKSGDCILSASKMMIRRAAIMKGSKEWSSITNKSLRGRATIFGLLRNSYTFDSDGISYSISSGRFKGKGNKARLREVKALLAAHPEGIVVHGWNAARSGAHGVLIVSVTGGVPYAADSTNNTGSRNEGIQKWSDTTMRSIKYVKNYWLISETGPAVSRLRIKSCSRPGTLKKGEGFVVKGKIKSDKKITSVSAQIKDLSGNVEYSAYAEPGRKKYDLRAMDGSLLFSALDKGKYRYTVTASDTSRQKVLINRKFRVK